MDADFWREGERGWLSKCSAYQTVGEQLPPNRSVQCNQRQKRWTTLTAPPLHFFFFVTKRLKETNSSVGEEKWLLDAFIHDPLLESASSKYFLFHQPFVFSPCWRFMNKGSLCWHRGQRQGSVEKDPFCQLVKSSLPRFELKMLSCFPYPRYMLIMTSLGMCQGKLASFLAGHEGVWNALPHRWPVAGWHTNLSLVHQLCPV